MAGLRYDEIEAGQRFTSAGRTLTETDHALFMMLVGDWHAIHADEEYARRTAAGRRLMHASLGLSLAMGLQAQAMAFADPMIGAIGLRTGASARRCSSATPSISRSRSCASG